MRIVRLQRVRVRLEEAAADEDVCHEAAQTLLAREPSEELSAQRKRGRHFFETEARDLLDEIDLAAHVTRAPRGHADVPGVVELEAEPLEAAALLVFLDRNADDVLHVRGAKLDKGPCGELRLHVCMSRPARADEFDEEFRRVVRGRLGQLGRHALLPARLRLRAHVQALAAAHDAELLEVRRLEQDRHRLGRDLALLAAHDPCDRDGPLGVRDDEILVRESPLVPVERPDRLSVTRAADDDASLRQLRVVERVQRVTERQHHVVRDVDDVRDRPHPGAEEARLEPLGRVSDAHIGEETHDVAGAALEVVDADVHRVGFGHGRGLTPRHVRERNVQEGRDLARDAVDRHEVGAVVPGLDLEDRVG